MSGVRIVQRPQDPNLQALVMANSASFDLDDPVMIDSSGFLAPLAGTAKVAGFFAMADVTAAADNQTVGAVKGVFMPVNSDIVCEATSDQACVATDRGVYADFAISGGVYTLNLSAGASGQAYIMDFDPNGDGSTTLVRFKVAEREPDAYAQV